MSHSNSHLSLCIKGKLVNVTKPLVMAIVNITPDSFYTESRIANSEQLTQRIENVLKDGASIIDIGAYSSRPNATHIAEKEEITRIGKALDLCRKVAPNSIISVDTFRASVAEFAIREYGADMINDISGGTMDSDMFDSIAKWNVPYVLTHIQGTPQTMQQNPTYKHLIPEMLYYFSEKINQLKQRGVNDIIIDPGFGFGKTIDQNYAIIANFEVFHQFELPILVGISRKSMIQQQLGTTAENSLNGTSVLHTLLIEKGAHILRVHDVQEATEIIALTQKIKTIRHDV
ncbi:MAG: dihydropteroate synthase [Paludibacteraceae bacterium]|nr:dihydropteroate synthase [Paludibacteraceae bacterium]MBP6284163.1 dihydropteroate synthase [Paludibacteraceae bacterium]